MIALKIAHILNARGIDKHFTYLVNAGFSNHVAHKVLNQKTLGISFKEMESLCRILVCEPNDILVFHPSKNHPLPESHPLNNLIKSDEQDKNIRNSLRYLPYKDLMNMTNQIHNTVNQTKERPDNTAEPV